jgi:hypothetical protein
MTSPKDKPAAAPIKKLLSHNPDGQRDLPVGHALWVRCFARGFTLQKPGGTGRCLRRIGPPQGHTSISRNRDATMASMPLQERLIGDARRAVAAIHPSGPSFGRAENLAQRGEERRMRGLPLSQGQEIVDPEAGDLRVTGLSRHGVGALPRVLDPEAGFGWVQDQMPPVATLVSRLVGYKRQLSPQHTHLPNWVTSLVLLSSRRKAIYPRHERCVASGRGRG